HEIHIARRRRGGPSNAGQRTVTKQGDGSKVALTIGAMSAKYMLLEVICRHLQALDPEAYEQDVEESIAMEKAAREAVAAELRGEGGAEETEETEEGSSTASTQSAYSQAGNVIAMAIEMQQGKQQGAQRAARGHVPELTPALLAALPEQTRAHYQKALAQQRNWPTTHQRAEFVKYWAQAVEQSLQARRDRALRAQGSCVTSAPRSPTSQCPGARTDDAPAPARASSRYPTAT
ncbi:hypothetical protein T492DRAFT_1123791, partial [Pavlovales sp. CCMP2436]